METIAVDRMEFTRCGRTAGGQKHLIVRADVQGGRALELLPRLLKIARGALAGRDVRLRTEKDSEWGTLQSLSFSYVATRAVETPFVSVLPEAPFISVVVIRDATRASPDGAFISSD